LAAAPSAQHLLAPG